MDKADASALAQKMVAAVRDFVARSETAINDRLTQFEFRLAAIPAGEKGDPGKSVTVDDVAPLVASAVAKAVAELPPPKPGEPGKTAEVDYQRIMADLSATMKALIDTGVAAAVAQIPAAQPGKDAEPIHPDTVARLVAEQVSKAMAALVLPTAKDGDDGRDAAQLEPLPGIDETRSYPRGTWASHAGGLIRAARATDPLTDDLAKAGWVVMVEGVAAVVVTQGDDPRQMEVAAMLTSGTKAIAPFYVPMVIDKGIWRDGEYKQGDHVTTDGSGWIAQRGTHDRPGTSDAWRLSTKKGRDGKDAPAGPQPLKTVRTA